MRVDVIPCIQEASDRVKDFLEIYSGGLYLSVLSLKHVELATDEDKQQGLDKWAAAFLATTWEEFQMLAAENSVYENIADEIYNALADDAKRDACRRYEEQKAVEARFIRERDDALQKIKEKDAAIQEKDVLIQEKDIAIHEKDRMIQEAKNQIAELERALAEAKRQN